MVPQVVFDRVLQAGLGTVGREIFVFFHMADFDYFVVYSEFFPEFVNCIWGLRGGRRPPLWALLVWGAL